MGCAASAFTPEKIESRKIDRGIAKDKARDATIVKLLLLGTGDSGKSTIMKQVRLLHERVFTEAELSAAAPVAVGNLVEAAACVIKAMGDKGVAFADKENARRAEVVVKAVVSDEDQEVALKCWCPSSLPLPASLSSAVLSVISDPSFSPACAAPALPDSAAYLFAHAGRLLAAEYASATAEDVLRARVVTTGIVEADFHMAWKGVGLNFRLIDVGGQRSERRKWIHCFEGVHAVMFVVSLSEYNQRLVEDASASRMTESLVLFESIVNNAFFTKTAFIVFFNKVDLLAEKLRSHPLEEFCPSFRTRVSMGLDHVEEAKRFLASLYLQKVKHDISRKDRKVYHHFVVATAIAPFAKLFEDVVKIIIEKSLQDVNLQ